MKTIYHFILLIILTTNLILPQGLTINHTDSVQHTQYRCGVELPGDYQSYEDKYRGKKLNEGKRNLFPLSEVNSNTGVWTELNPRVPRVEYLGIHFVNPDTGWAVGVGGSIITTIDGGVNWQMVNSPTPGDLLNVNSFNGQVVIATGNDGAIIRSEDSGNSWQQLLSGVGGDLWRVQMLNDTLGWICGLGPTLLKTTDAGVTWNPVNTGYTTFQYWSLDFCDENTGYIAGGYGNVLKTTDGGDSWQHFDISSVNPNSLYAIDVVNPRRVITGGFGRIAYTTDGGNNWAYVGSSGVVNTIAFADSLTGYAGENEGFVMKTTDGGITWQSNIWFPTYSKNWIMFVNDTLGYIAGSSLNIQKTTDKGLLWNSCIINDDFKDVYFLNKDTGWAVSDFNFYKTTDAGDNWIKQSNPPRARSLYFIDSLTGFAGDRNNGKIYKTTNGGDTWYETNTTGINGDIGRIIFLDSLTGFALNGNILKTSDGGESWSIKLSIPSTYFDGICSSNDSTVWAVGGDTYPFEIYKSLDKGDNWIPIPFEEQEKRDVFFLNEQIGFITAFSQLYKTTDGGLSFQADPSVSDFSFGRFENYLSQSIFIIGSRVFVTTNGGEEWLDYPEVHGEGLIALSLYEVNRGYAVGSMGIILIYFDESIPVELNNFSATATQDEVLLRWETATEKSNKGFEVERRGITSEWQYIGFIAGNGTTTLTHSYSFTDKYVLPGKYLYRLKQIDFDGSYEYSKEVEVELKAPLKFNLKQNYPNPFNPSTKISFTLPIDSKVTIKIYDVLGREITTLVNRDMTAGYYDVEFNASAYPSGVYFYRLIAEDIYGQSYYSIKKMVLTK